MRRYADMKPSRGTIWPPEVRERIRARDRYCVCDRANFPQPCRGGSLELDHVRASGGTSMKSRSTDDNGVLLAAWCHRWKTEHGKEARPLLLEYLSKFGYGEVSR